MNVFYAKDLKEYKDALLDWVTLCQLDDNVACIKMNRNTYNQIKAEVVDAITLKTDNPMNIDTLVAYLTGIPIVFNDDMTDYMIKTDDYSDIPDYCIKCCKAIRKSDPHVIAYKNRIPACFCREHLTDAGNYLDWYLEFVSF